MMKRSDERGGGGGGRGNTLDSSAMNVVPIAFLNTHTLKGCRVIYSPGNIEYHSQNVRHSSDATNETRVYITVETPYTRPGAASIYSAHAANTAGLTRCIRYGEMDPYNRDT